MIRGLFIVMLMPLFYNAQIRFSEQNVDLGDIEEAYEIKGDIVLTNTSAKKIFLMRADADFGIQVYTSKKALLPNDTCLLVISFIPETRGRFKKKIKLVTTDQATPYELNLTGNLNRVKTNDRMACVYFGKRKPPGNTAAKEHVVVVTEDRKPKEVSNKLPDISENTPPLPDHLPEQPQSLKTVPDDFSLSEYKPNNIIFLVDISSSMRDSLKLPLMKTALHKLIEAVREVDSITFITYASQVKVIKEAVGGNNKQLLHQIVDSLKAKGMTAGRTAILFSQQLAQKHYIADGNNQIIIATDGEFKFEKEDQITWKKRQADKKIILSTVAFGEDKVALRNLKDIASKGEGSFIQIRQKNGSDATILEEIKMRSRK